MKLSKGWKMCFNGEGPVEERPGSASLGRIQEIREIKGPWRKREQDGELWVGWGAVYIVNGKVQAHT